MQTRAALLTVPLVVVETSFKLVCSCSLATLIQLPSNWRHLKGDLLATQPRGFLRQEGELKHNKKRLSCMLTLPLRRVKKTEEEEFMCKTNS